LQEKHQKFVNFREFGGKNINNLPILREFSGENIKVCRFYEDLTGKTPKFDKR
jgi:hypothetical protein